MPPVQVPNPSHPSHQQFLFEYLMDESGYCIVSNLKLNCYSEVLDIIKFMCSELNEDECIMYFGNTTFPIFNSKFYQFNPSMYSNIEIYYPDNLKVKYHITQISLYKYSDYSTAVLYINHRSNYITKTIYLQ